MPPIPSPIDNIAHDVCAELGLDMGGGTERRIARLIRETIITENERCATLVETMSPVGDMSEGFDACRASLARAAHMIRNLPITTS